MVPLATGFDLSSIFSSGTSGVASCAVTVTVAPALEPGAWNRRQKGPLCAFFEGVYEGRKILRRRQAFTAALKGIQTGLGRLNDMQVHCKLAHRLAHSKHAHPKQTEKAFAIGLLTGKERAEAAAILVDTVKVARNIANVKPFWR